MFVPTHDERVSYALWRRQEEKPFAYGPCVVVARIAVGSAGPLLTEKTSKTIFFYQQQTKNLCGYLIHLLEGRY